MDVLILGHSSIAQRRVVPALHALPHIGRIDVATRKAADGTSIDWPDGKVYGDYRKALHESDAELVYISLVNSEHERWTEAAIEAGRHVVVDKPAFLGVPPTERLLDLADRHGVCVAEATVWAAHPQVQCARELFAEAGCVPKRITAEFCFPALDASNFRYQQALGGGALWDVGPYAISVGRTFFGGEPETVACQVLEHGGPDPVETAFSVLLTYSGGRSVVGQFGFNSVYRNRVDLLGERLGVAIDRIYTTPPGVANELEVTKPDGQAMVQAPQGDAFGAFFDHVRASTETHDWARLRDDILADARALDRLRRAAGVA
jgi:dTDP-3,4-didehydro-2,6-dideoxy-alpha-D-glucose 3-reductase